MTKVNAIAFDLVGVLVKENDCPLSVIERLLESKFGLINFDDDYYKWATEQTGLSKGKIEFLIKGIINEIYEIRELDIFRKLPELKFALATNHLSVVDGWVSKQKIFNNFYCFVNSAKIGFQKPEKEFYIKLSKELKERPENILFVDDDVENIKGAKNAGFKVLHYDGKSILSEEIVRFINYA